MVATKVQTIVLVVIAVGIVGAVAQAQPKPAPTTLEDFFRAGSQPDGGYEGFLSSTNCGTCHGGQNDKILINQPWSGSMHGQSARDALWFACLTVAEQDAPFVGDMCIRCHVPRAWLMGRSKPTDGSAINRSDRDGISCSYCHRLVDPFYKEGISPKEDKKILDDLKDLPIDFDAANTVIDPFDRRRGAREGIFPPHSKLVSPFFGESTLCGHCHDVSNPALDRQEDDTYVGNEADKRHPTGKKYDMFPGERTFSEWTQSEYAAKGVDAGGRFGGNKRIVSSCQDCHMPDTTSKNSDGGPMRDDTAAHDFAGGGTWMPLVVANLYPDEVDVEVLKAGIARSESMLKRAATMKLNQSGDTLDVRLINETGHKLPTGQPEGRQVWLNVKFFDADGKLIAERGAYDGETGRPTLDDTSIYEITLGIDEAVAEATGLPVGPTHHVAFCNVIYKDTRIPPRGFTNEGLRRVSAPIIGAGYSDGQYWDDTQYALPSKAVKATVGLYYKTASTEFIEFLRDANFTNDAGKVLYEQWEKTGKSPPVLMVSESIDLGAFVSGDFDGDRVVDLQDYKQFEACMQGPGSGPIEPECRPGDLDSDKDVDLDDFARFQLRFGDLE